MRVLIISGSMMRDSNSIKLAQLIQQEGFSHSPDVTTEILSLADFPYLLHHYSDNLNDADSLKMNNEKSLVLNSMYACDAVVFIVPEWGGMVPPAVVNLLLLSAQGSADGFPLGHKPAFIIGLSASGGGTYPISLLRGYAAKNSHIVIIPFHAIVRNVEKFLEQNWPLSNKSHFTETQERIAIGLESLCIYGRSLKGVREQLLALSEPHPYGQ